MKVSIIVATFNAAKTLSRALDSVLNQSFQDWECIIVDGASTDSTMEIVKEYVKKDSRIRYISEPDKGIYDAFNKGWKMAKGEWVYYWGADDILIEEAMLDVSKYMLKDECDILYGDMIFNTYFKLKKKISLESESLKGHMVSHQSMFMKKECIQNLGGFDLKYKISADFALVQKAIKAGMKFKHVNIFVAIFQCNGISASGYANIFEAYKIKNEYKTASKIENIFYVIRRLCEKTIKFSIKKVCYLLNKK